jgi:Arginine/lysine/ornithine decarboxylases
MPGHIGAKGIMPPELEALLGLDVTEVEGLDDLHLAQGIIAASRQKLAQACGAAESFFLVNGTTSGIHALFMSFADNDSVMIPRNAHRSFYGGMVLSGIKPVYIPCVVQPELGIALGVQAEQIEALLALHSDVKGVFITSPSYYGTCCDIAGIAAVVHKWGKILMVDEAHGAHFPFHPLYPHSALQDGAQAAVNGLHKTWPVLTQGACLHLGKAFSHRSRLLEAYNILTTTSPSYLLLASIDLARDFMESSGQVYLERAIAYSYEFKNRLKTIKGIRCYDGELLDIPGVQALDPLKILIGVQGLSLDGYQTARILRAEYHIQVEMAEPNFILAMFSLLHNRADWDKFYTALADVACRYPAGGGKELRPVCLPPPAPMVYTPRQAYLAAAEKVGLTEAKGRLAGEMVAPYPPGIPCLLPGELIDDEVWEYLNYLKTTGASLQGPEEPELEHIKVLI